MDRTNTTSRASSARGRSTRAAADRDPLDVALESTTEPTEHTTRTSGIVGTVKERATAQLNTQKERATEGLGSIAQAVRQTTDKLREDQQDMVAQYVEKAADQIERFSNSLRERDINELVQDVQRFARRQPALFIGGSFAAGLLAARFLKSSGDARGAGEYSAREHEDYPTSAAVTDPSRGAY